MTTACAFEWAATPFDTRLFAYAQPSVAVEFRIQGWEHDVRILCDGTVYEKDDLRFYCEAHGELVIIVLDQFGIERFYKKPPRVPSGSGFKSSPRPQGRYELGCSNLMGRFETLGRSFEFKYLLHQYGTGLNIFYCEPSESNPPDRLILTTPSAD